jgi:hypothetical protein
LGRFDNLQFFTTAGNSSSGMKTYGSSASKNICTFLIHWLALASRVGWPGIGFGKILFVSVDILCGK